MTEWYMGHDSGDLIVPKDQQVYFDRLPSPDSWSQWGVCGNSGWSNNFDEANEIVTLPDQKPQHRASFGRGNGLINRAEAELSYGSNSNNMGGSSEDSLPWNSAACGGCPDMQFDNLTGTDSMDDLLLSSLLHDDVPAATHTRRPFNLPPQSKSSTMPSDNRSAERMVNFQSISSDKNGLGSSKCFRSPPFSPSDGSDNGHSSVPQFSYGNSSDQSHGLSAKALETMEMLFNNQEAGGKDSSIEESVLLGLEVVLNQLSSTTRLCFRDSLYRLAQRSQSQMIAEVSVDSFPLDAPALLETSDAQTRSARTMTTESETNTIDRAVANLMFHMVDNADALEFLPSRFAKFEQGSNKSSADSEVPIFSH